MYMMKSKYLLFIVSAFIMQFFFSCKPQVPSKYLQPDEMEDILFDYHIAMNMIDENDTADFEKRIYEAEVLKKHGVTRAEFDSSLVYYTRHSDNFLSIYENLSKRLSDEAVSLGASASEISSFGENASMGDTTNVWKGTSSLVLATEVPYNVESFHIVADTSYHKRDRIVLSFDTQFVFQDGYRDAVAMLAVYFKNDSVSVQTVHISESNHYDISIGDDGGLGIKSIRGFISLQNAKNASATTMKLMFVSNLRLIRCHVKQDAAGGNTQKSVPEQEDSLVADPEKKVHSMI